MKLKICFFISFLVLLLGCKKNEESYTQINVRMYDVPAYFDSLFIHLHAIEIIDEKSNYKEKLKLNHNKSIDILTYTGGKDTLLGKIAYKTPNISHLKITFSKRVRAVKNHNSFLLNWATDTVILLSLKNHISLLQQSENDILVDLDVFRSIKWLDSAEKKTPVFKPNIAVRTKQNAGWVKGKIIVQGFRPYVWLSTQFDTIGTQVNENGTFTIFHVPSGEYKFFVSLEDGSVECFIEKIEIKPNEVTGIGTILITKNL